MKPVFFPHTFIEPDLAMALNAIWGPITLFHPLAAAADQLETLKQTKQIELVLPRPDGADLVLGAYEGFKRWASEHTGQDLAGLLQQGPAIPYFDADATSRIAAEIKSAGAGPVETAGEERLQRARLLLLMAQDLDLKRRELETDLKRLQDHERRMLAMLKGEAAIDDAARDAWDESAVLSMDTGRATLHMVPARMAAWARLALEAEAFWRQHAEILFLTASLDVLDDVREQAEAEVLLNDHRVAPETKDELVTWLIDSQRQATPPASPAANAAPASVALTIIRLPQLTPRQWLRLLAGKRVAAPGDYRRPSAISGFLVGHVKLI